jgi:hypothetical protein
MPVGHLLVRVSNRSSLSLSHAAEDTFTYRTPHFEGGHSVQQKTKPKNNSGRVSIDTRQLKLSKSQATVSHSRSLHSAQNGADGTSSGSSLATDFKSAISKSHHNVQEEQGKKGSAAQRSLQKVLTRPTRSKTETIGNRACDNVRQQDNLNNVSSSSSPISSSSCSTSSSSSSSCLSDIYQLFGDKNETDKK